MTDSTPLIKGTLDILVLKTLSWGAMHGPAIASWLEERAGGNLHVEESALYYALHRLEERGRIDAEWGITDNNRRARYYRLTAAGRAYLRAESSRFIGYADTLIAVLRTATRDA